MLRPTHNTLRICYSAGIVNRLKTIDLQQQGSLFAASATIAVYDYRTAFFLEILHMIE